MPDTLVEWIRNHQGLLWYGGAGSLVIFIVSLLAIPPIIVRIEPDYFTHPTRPPSRWRNQHPFIRAALAIGKNLLGAVLMLMGVAMLILPGQGLLTLAVGFLLLDFPGKYRLEKRLIRRPLLLRGINWLRRRRNRPPLKTEPEGPSPG